MTNCHQLKLKAADEKRTMPDIATTEELLRIIQSVPSKKAEPIKLWLAEVGRESNHLVTDMIETSASMVEVKKED